MIKMMKCAVALVLAVSTLLTLVLLVSCGDTTGAIEDFLTSDNYTFKAGALTVKVDSSTVYYNDGVTTKYLFLDKTSGRYFYCEIGADGTINKEALLSSEKYILYYGQLVSTVASTTKILTGFLQTASMLEEVDGAYTVGNYTVKESDGVITCITGSSVAEVSSVGSTTVEVPKSVLSADEK